MPRESRADEVAQERSRRVPMGGPQLKLQAEQRPGFVRRWVNDIGGRIQRFQEAGYAIVEDTRATESTDSVGSRRTKLVGTTEYGQPMHAVLMEQREEFYREDFHAKQAAQDEVMSQIKRGKPGGERQSAEDKNYVPERGISIEQG